ncbi:MAG: UvrD-helicase domain-containing protein, partial [Armatimonadota bacterium]
MSDRPTEDSVAADNDALRDAIITNSARHQFLSAGAGAGKTTVLVDHYFHLLSNGCRPSQLVAVTFTEKAASEMKSRLRGKCRAR